MTALSIGGPPPSLASAPADALAAHAATYARELDVPRDYRPLAPYRRGRLFVVDQNSGALHPIHATLPDGIRAGSDDQIGTLAGIVWREARAFTYRNAARTEAFRINCTVVLVDRPARKVVGEQLF